MLRKYLLLLLWLPITAAAEVEVSFITTSYAKPAAEFILVKGGSVLRQRALVQGAVIVRHGEQTFLYDTGLGRSIDEQMSDNGWLGRAIFAYSEVNPVIDQLEQQGMSAQEIDFIVPSHLHWDHTSGFSDFPQTPIWVQAKELSQARKGHRPNFIPETLTEQFNWRELELLSKPFLGFERSLDLFADGRVVLVGLPGHTAGQVGLYVEVSEQQRYFFIGDASWTATGIEQNQKRSSLIRHLVKLNHDETSTDDTLLKLHQLSQADPALILVPVHDEQVVATLPNFPIGLTWN